MYTLRIKQVENIIIVQNSQIMMFLLRRYNIYYNIVPYPHVHTAYTQAITYIAHSPATSINEPSIYPTPAQTHK